MNLIFNSGGGGSEESDDYTTNALFLADWPEQLGILLNVVTNITILSALIDSKIWLKGATIMKTLLLVSLFVNLTIYFLRGSDLEFLVTVANVFSLVFFFFFKQTNHQTINLLAYPFYIYMYTI